MGRTVSLDSPPSVRAQHCSGRRALGLFTVQAGGCLEGRWLSRWAKGFLPTNASRGPEPRADSHHYNQLLQSVDGWEGYTHTAKGETHWKGALEEKTWKGRLWSPQLEESPEFKFLFLPLLEFG